MRKLMSMVGAVEDLIEADRAKLYCVDSFDVGSWSADHLPLEERARRHAGYESWIVDVVVPHIRADTGDSVGIATAGCSMARSTLSTSRSSGPTCSRWHRAAAPGSRGVVSARQRL